MINRALLRIKVAQVLYACFAKENTDLTAAENELQLSMQKSYDLYHYILLLIAESRRYTEVSRFTPRSYRWSTCKRNVQRTIHEQQVCTSIRRKHRIIFLCQ